ncbi:MAG TPA: PmoA family protein [Actinophytocola sp.]|jgi:hypothetical protein|uniref:DUF6807 domain-containing protein n=1 Tax=Actinophytocola sp. TaxID=1872138 RepID=UPI002F936CC5
MDLTTGTAWLRFSHDGTELARYVFEPWDVQLESPRPYFHPLRTLAGDVVSLYRPHDHVWHKGIAWSLPHVGPANFWGGPTFRRGRGYEQLPNNGTTRHLSFGSVSGSSVREELAWDTEQGERWFTESRALTFAVADGSWTLGFATTFTNVWDAEIVLGSPTTNGRANAGYGGLFWRGPRSFTGGEVTVPGRTGGDELMGVRAPWLAFRGQHDGSGRFSTLVFEAESAESDVRWFVRSTPFAAVCPAPFFDTEAPVAPGESLSYRYRIVIANGSPDPAELVGRG